MQLDLNDHEGALLRNILERHLGDFRMEIRDTENYDMRKSMQEDEESLKRILKALGSRVPATN
jgi:hypothetical protein